VKQDHVSWVVSRREFCAHVCEAATLAAAGSLLAACSSPTSPGSSSAPSLSPVTASVTGRTVSIALDSAAALATVGSAAIAQTSLGTFLIARIAQDTYSVLTAGCTHQACTVSGYESQRFVCPCHGSQFTTSGAVVSGPAPTGLRQYASQVANNVLSFTV
jgi:cytochrome b6-f complex iron-sulfur subunit